MVTFAAGYIAGVFCAIVSHPADSVVSVINKNPGRTAGDSEYKFMSGTNIIKKFSLEGNGTKGCLEGSWCPYHHDRYIDCSPMVHLRWCQGRPSTSTTTTTTNARITSIEARGTGCCQIRRYSPIHNSLILYLFACDSCSKTTFALNPFRSPTKRILTGHRNKIVKYIKDNLVVVSRSNRNPITTMSNQSTFISTFRMQ